MADDSGFGLILAAIIDVLLGESAKKHKWARALKYIGGILFLLTIMLLIFITIKYS